MNRFQKILAGAVVLLVIVNIILLAFIWSYRPEWPREGGRHRPEISGRFLLSKLEVTREQRAEFTEELRAHKDRMDVLNRAVRIKKHEVTKAIIQGDSSNLPGLNQDLFEAQKNMELESQRLTVNLARICSDEQKQKYLELMDDILRRDPNGSLRGRKSSD